MRAAYTLSVKLAGRGNRWRFQTWYPGGDIFGPTRPDYPKTIGDAVALEFQNPAARTVTVKNPDGYIETWHRDGTRTRPHPPSNNALRKGKKK